MKARAGEELSKAVETLPEAEAELVLSVVHLLRASRGDAAAAVRQALVKEFETEPQGWLSLEEPALARDWNRPEEEDAWADL